MAAPPEPRLRPRFLIGADPRALEAELLRESTLPAGGDPGARTFFVAPTRRLLDHLQSVLTSGRGALAGVHFLHHRGLATHLHELAGAREPAEASAPLLQLLLAERLRPLDSELARYLERQPAAIGALLATLRDLRDAGIDSAAARDAPLSPRGRETIALLAAFEELLARLEPQGASDGAGHSRSAQRAAEGRTTACARLIHYGAYELIGVHRRLLLELTRRVPATFLVAASDAAGPAQELAAAFGAPLEAIGTPPATRRTRLVSCAGPREEMRLAVRTLLAWHENDGVPFASMAILARHASSHRRALRAEAALQGLEPDTSIKTPLADDPLAQRLRLFLTDATSAASDAERAAARDFRRIGPPGVRVAPLARWARDSGGGALAATLEAAARELARHERELAALADPARLAGHLLHCIDEAHLVDDEDEAGERKLRGGLRVLDLHQGRALPFERAVLVGANDRLLPQRARDDFFLCDADRGALRDATGAPVPLRQSTRRDEELLFDSVCAAVRDELVVSFARADDGDKDAAPSLFLRRLGLDPGRPELLIPRAPREEHRVLLARTGLLTAQEALLEATAATAPASRRRAAQRDLARFAGALGVDAGAFAAGVARSVAIDDGDGAELQFDGAGIAVRPKPDFSPTELAQLGRCPLQYFFARELGVKAREEPTDGELSPRHLGELLHETLASLYREVLPPGRPVAAAAIEPLARERLPEHFERAAARLAPAQRPAPRLWNVRRAQLLRDLAAFVAADLRQIEQLELRAGLFEEPQQATLDFAGRTVGLSFRIDRILVDAAGGEWIADYKLTSVPHLEEQVKPLAAVRASALQLPLYRLARLAQGRRVAGLQFLSLRRPRPRDDGPILTADLDRLAANDDALRDSLAALLEARDAGTFPLVSDRDDGTPHCSRCDFRRACRHSHPPTVARVEQAAQNARFYALAEKTLKKGDDG
jgi:PD-(D/E)XK nuclease superfamily protein